MGIPPSWEHWMVMLNLHVVPNMNIVWCNIWGQAGVLKFHTWGDKFFNVWLVLFWRDILLQYFLVSITLGVNFFTGVSHFASEGILALTIPQLWIVLDCKSTLSCFDLQVSHNGCIFFHNYKQLWIWSLHFRSWVWWFHSKAVNFFTTMNTLNWILYFCTLILRFHTWHVNFFTTINNSRIEVCIFVH